MANDLSGKRIAIVVANGFEQIEMTDPREALENAGAETDLISIEDGEVKGWEHTAWGDAFPVDVPIEDADPDDYDGLLLPGGVMNPDRLRKDDRVVEFVRAFFDAAVGAGAEVLHEPRLWPEYHPHYYGAFVRDPDGNNVEAVCHRPEPE